MCVCLFTQGPPGEQGDRGEPGDEGYQVDMKNYNLIIFKQSTHEKELFQSPVSFSISGTFIRVHTQVYLIKRVCLALIIGKFDFIAELKVSLENL